MNTITHSILITLVATTSTYSFADTQDQLLQPAHTPIENVEWVQFYQQSDIHHIVHVLDDQQRQIEAGYLDDSDQNQDIAANSKLAVQNQQQLEKNTRLVGETDERLDMAAMLLDKHEMEISSIGEGLNEHQQRIEDNTHTASNNQKHTTENAKIADSNQQNIAIQHQQIESINATNQSQDQRIQQNKNDISGLKQDMKEMANMLDGSFAASAAFSGLVEPYSVGKVSVTAGLGYHGSAQAIAIGASERFTEQFTAKLGGSYDTATQSETAFVGVGYEF